MYQVSKPFPKPKSSSPDDLKIHASELSHRVEQELRAIAQAITGQITITRNFSTGGSSGGGGGGGGSNPLAVKSLDLLTVINPATEIRFDTDDGYVLTNAGGGIARLDFDSTFKGLYRCASNAILSTGTAITFSKVMTGAAVLPLLCVNGSGDQIGVGISNITTTGFLATPIEDATLVWLAFPDWIPRDGVAIIQPGGTTVVLQVPFADTSYGILVRQCFNANGDAIGVTLSAKTATDFVADPIETATLYYQCIKFQ